MLNERMHTHKRRWVVVVAASLLAACGDSGAGPPPPEPPANRAPQARGSIPDQTLFRRSGVNVEFRPVIVAYQDYKHFGVCQLDSMHRDNASLYALAWSLAPSLRWVLQADLLHNIKRFHGPGLCGMAGVRNKGESAEDVWGSGMNIGETDPICGDGRDHRQPNVNHKSQRSNFIGVLAHEIGHNLGLYHNPGDYTRGDGAKGVVRHIFHPSGWGYKGEITLAGGRTVSYGTIMSIGASRVPFFNPGRVLPKSEVCSGDATRYDYETGYGFCPANGHEVAGDSIRLGGPVEAHDTTYHVNAAEALQYTIADASKYACRPGSCQ